jgi:hypothetical protein
MMCPTKAATTTARTAPIVTTSLNLSGSFGEPLLDGLQLGLCDTLGLFIRCAARTRREACDYTLNRRAGRTILARTNA